MSASASAKAASRERLDTGLDVVTGAFGYSGRAIADLLEESGRRVRTLTNHARPGPTAIETRPLDFSDPAGLVSSLSGATTLYNTYWVRFPHGASDHPRAVANSRVLFDAAREAGVQRIVHVSITNPSLDSPYPYFRGKAEVEEALTQAGVSRAVVRPAVLFGGDGVLINNIAWLLRRLPVFAVGGDGSYRLRPIHVEDLGRLCVTLGRQRTDQIVDAVGPERPTFGELVGIIREAVGATARIIHLPGALMPSLARVLGLVLRDVLLTEEEYRAMADGLADTQGPPSGDTSLSSWIAGNASSLGRRYANELDRHFR